MTNFQTDSILDSDLDLDAEDRDQNQDETLNQVRTERTRELPLQVPSITNSPRCAPSQPLNPNPARRARPVRVDAWAVPASANWSRTRTTVRKVSRGTRSTDWALPF